MDKESKTITGRVKKSILDGIRQQHHKPGTQLPGLRDLARQYNASAGSVRNALRELAFEGILEIKHGKGTYVTEGAPVTRVIGTKISNILVVMPKTPAVDKLRSMALRHGLLMSYYQTLEDKQDPKVEKQLLEMARDNHYLGVIITPTPKAPTNEKLFAELRAAGTKVILTGRYTEHMTGEDCLLPDFRRAARVATTRMALAGYRHVTCLNLSEDWKGIPARLLYRGYQEAVTELELSSPPALFHPPESQPLNDEFLAELKALPEKTAILSRGTRVPTQLVSALHSIGRQVPEDIGVVGICGLYGPCEDAEVTRMSFDLEDLTQKALACVVENQTDSQEVKVRTRYVRARFVQGATTLPDRM
ncbi:MAG: GntR family transcriptional regulator [Candidatus Pacebacteria bacterium]|nr:GntR family transcriptional regulator [Candidatus Paceibacterota bacterium]